MTTPECAVCGELAAELHHWAPRSMFGKDEAELWPRSWLCTTHHQQWHNVMRVAVPAPTLKAIIGDDGGTIRAPLTHEERCAAVKRKDHGIKRQRVSTWRCQLRVGHDGPHHVPGQAPWEEA
jgi:hypothetical protein